MRRLALLMVMFAASGCGLMPSREPAKTDFDFGPHGVAVQYGSKASPARIVVYDITAPAWMDHSSMYYRLAYRNAANPMTYARSEWVMSPAALLTQRLRSRLADSIDGAARRVSADTPESIYVLRSELIEFEQIFDQPDRSRGVLRLRATLEGGGVWAQRTFAIEKPAPTADAPGGVRALNECSEELASLIAGWVSEIQPGARKAVGLSARGD
jgi:cholesterol transport system auxiliary component